MASILLVTWVVLCVAGGLVLLMVDTQGRKILLPALPGLGAMALAALLHWPSLFMGVKSGLVVLFPAAGLVAFWRRSRTAQLPPAVVRVLLIATLAGIPALLVGLIPQTRVDGPRLVQPTWNNDAYAYVTLTDWLQDHAATDRPSLPPRPPAYDYARAHLENGLRVGEELVQATAATLTGRDPAITWYTVTALWLLLLPGAMAAAAQLLGLSVGAGMAAGALTSLSTLTTGQLFNQNAASLLGIAIVPVTLALLLAAVFETGPWRPPVWLVGLSIAGLFATYSEYLPILALGLGAGLLATWFSTGLTVFGRALRKCVHIGLFAVVLAPLAWYNLVRALLLEYRIAGRFSLSPFLDTTGWAVINRYAGVASFQAGGSPSLLGPLICGAILLGVIAALWSAPGRRVAAYVASSAFLIYVLSFVRPYDYAQLRAIEITLPVVFLGVAVGFHTVFRRIRARSQPLAVVVAAPLGLLLAAFSIANVQTARETTSSPIVVSRTVDADFSEALGWLRNVVRGKGENLLVLDSHFFQQLWIMYLLREWPQVDYPFIYGDYTKGLEGRGLWDSKLRSYALVGTRDYVDADPGVIMAENNRYRLLDLSKGQALVAMPVAGFNYDQFVPERRYQLWMEDQARLLVFRTPGYPKRAVLSGMGLPELSPLDLRASNPDGAILGDSSVTGDPSRLILELPEQVLNEVVVTSSRKAVPPVAGQPGRSFLVTSVSRL